MKLCRRLSSTCGESRDGREESVASGGKIEKVGECDIVYQVIFRGVLGSLCDLSISPHN